MPKGLPIAYIKKWGISKKAWREFRKGTLTKGVHTRTAAIKRRLKGKNPKRRKTRMTKRRGRRGRRKFTIPIAPIVGLAAGFVGPAGDSPLNYIMKGDYNSALVRLGKSYTGYDANTGKWEPHLMMGGLLPLIIGGLVHKFVGGAPLNMNRMLASAGVPVVRI